MTFARVLTLAVLGTVAVYLFATRPEPLPDGSGTASEKHIPIARVFEAVNAINHEARRIFTARVVGEGQKAGLKFAEDWQHEESEAGPLPALFLRLVSSELAKRSDKLSLFLGSDEPINPSNRFSREQKVRFQQMKTNGHPQLFPTPDGLQVGMYPDVASVAPCVSCHNEHTTSPKRDWKLGDVMGATTWMHPDEEVSLQEFQEIIATVYSCVEGAWRIYLQKTTTFASPPRIGPDWPKAGSPVLPDAETFMAELYGSSAPKVMQVLNTSIRVSAAMGQ
jgi:adenylate cyclase